MNHARHIQTLPAGPLAPWQDALASAVQERLARQRHGDAARWEAALQALPNVAPDSVSLDRDTVTASGCLAAGDHAHLQAALQALVPWRKGPFRLFDIEIDTEWRSDWKWQRLAGAITSLAGRTVLDVGCGSGYHAFRMQGAGAAAVLGIDPYLLFHFQFAAVQHYLGAERITHLPLALEDLPPRMHAFDTVFSMGVLYHARSPIDHLTRLRDCLRPGGELVLETLVIEGGPREVLVPADRYARMRNVWFIPSRTAAIGWLQRCGFDKVREVDCNPTSVAEQRRTAWMPFESLQEALDPADPTRTVEGDPAPLRAVFVAENR